MDIRMPDQDSVLELRRPPKIEEHRAARRPEHLAPGCSVAHASQIRAVEQHQNEEDAHDKIHEHRRRHSLHVVEIELKGSQSRRGQCQSEKCNRVEVGFDPRQDLHLSSVTEQLVKDDCVQPEPYSVCPDKEGARFSHDAGGVEEFPRDVDWDAGEGNPVGFLAKPGSNHQKVGGRPQRVIHNAKNQHGRTKAGLRQQLLEDFHERGGERSGFENRRHRITHFSVLQAQDIE